jgi:hypothetical protein
MVSNEEGKEKKEEKMEDLVGKKRKREIGTNEERVLN